MNEQEREYFDKLSKDRAKIANLLLERRATRGIKDSVVEKYTDQAHFIYELLQNADDACATVARFVLEPDRLIFAHNGKRLFTVSNPENEDMDSETGKLGDINAITSIGNSNKTKEISIGKFGVGFKAVFQYTSTPHIYDKNFQFKIERFLVPVLLDKDIDIHNPEETLFVFPFDHPERNPVESYNDISNKLINLSYPLLFLSNLEYIELEFDNKIGLYEKKIKKSYTFDNTTAELVCMTQTNGDDLYDKNLWLFSRKDDNNHKYSVGFFIDGNGNLCAENEPAFCFFPTKEVTNLNFIIHAPFLLTDSREGIRAGVTHNDRMIKKLADLTASAIVYMKKIGKMESIRLINDDIVKIIPYDRSKFSELSDKRKISFLPFYTSVRKIFENEEILPSLNGYTYAKNAYWASVPFLTKLFSNKQLSVICNNPSACWVFTSIGRDSTQKVKKVLFNYIDSLIKTFLDDNTIINGRTKNYYYNIYTGNSESLEPIKGITAQFIESQSFEWLHKFYKWISETSHRRESVLRKPIFLNQERKAVAAFDDKNQLILFLPVKDISGYTVVHPDLLANPDTNKFIKGIGIKEPSLRDQIYNIILPLYKTNKTINPEQHFMMFFTYYCKCSNDEVDDFIDLIKEYKFVNYYNDYGIGRGKASDMYIPSSELTMYFKSKPSTKFVVLNEYKELVGNKKEKQLISFLSELGAKNSPCLMESPNNYKYHYNGREEHIIDGLEEIITTVASSQDKSLSVFLWNQLCYFQRNNILHRIKNATIYSRPDGRYKWRTSYEESTTITLLRSEAWIINSNGQFVSSDNVTKTSLSELYDTSSNEAQDLLEFLNIKEAEEEEDNEDDEDSNLTDEQKDKIDFAENIKNMGFTLEEAMEILKQNKKEKESSSKSSNVSQKKQINSDLTNTNSRNSLLDDNEVIDTTQRKQLTSGTSSVVKDIVERIKNEPMPPVFSETFDENFDDENLDSDEFIPVPVDYSRRIENAKRKSAKDIDRIACLEDLQTSAMEMPKYSFGWFKILLEMESLNNGEKSANSKEISISFSKVEREYGTSRTLILKYPSRYIPQFIEDLSDIPLVLHIGDTKKTLVIEVANIISYTLRVKLKSETDIQNIDFSKVNVATIDAQSPAFLLEELKKQFIALEYDDKFDMQKNLCKNIEFIFGPPGTGKTTHLAKNVILPLMKNNINCKILVLTPTNKAADVLVRRIMEVSGDNHSYEKWLVRFGATVDEEIEKSNVFKDKTFDIRKLPQNVTVTTIARFPYDFFMPQGTRIFLNERNWDYIIIDEASMIPIANIIYPLYKRNPQKFIIAGDPFQIEPITSVNLWKNENIYTLIHLNSFTNPKTVPYPYKVELLTTQFRSIPEIGNIFSNFAYGGILKHYRSSKSQRQINIDNGLNIKALNIIKFPVSKYESIYRAKRLQHSSSYQIYSALFTYEYICYLSKMIAKQNHGKLFKIGVIAPYRAQADLIDKLFSYEKIPEEIEIQVGTIHGFQGDECDMIFSVFNTPPMISANKEMFLNNLNIINVSVSRAKDYLFIVMPDDNTENIANLRLVKRIERLIKSTNSWTETFTHDLEKLIFGEHNYLENNVFSTGHQSVNVYGLPEKCYEVRTEDNAVDLQIHRKMKRKIFDKTDITNQNIKDEERLITLNKLKQNALKVQVTGQRTGIYYLVSYNGKLKKYTDKKVIDVFIPQTDYGKEKLLLAFVSDEENLIFIPENMFKKYKNK